MPQDKFTLPGEPFTDQTPLVQTHFWQWGRAQTGRRCVTVKHYLTAHGFVMGVHRIEPEELQTLTYACEHFHRTEPRIASPMRFSDAFKPATQGGYWVQGQPGRWNPEPVILQTLADAGWIYDINPQTTYFYVAGENLRAGYQQIIGSRCIVRIIAG